LLAARASSDTIHTADRLQLRRHVLAHPDRLRESCSRRKDANGTELIGTDPLLLQRREEISPSQIDRQDHAHLGDALMGWTLTS
jgi:hypothetical protein